MAKINQRKEKRIMNELYADKYKKFHSKEEKREARKERILKREQTWADKYFGRS